MERIQSLDSIEKEIIVCLQSAGTHSRKIITRIEMVYFGIIKLIFKHSIAGQALLELSKEKSSQKQAEGNTHQFLKTLNQVETKLNEQITYLTQVSTGQPHEGSGYASQKVLQMAWHRLEHVRSGVNELDRLKTSHMAASGRTNGSRPNGNSSVASVNVGTTTT